MSCWIRVSNRARSSSTSGARRFARWKMKTPDAVPAVIKLTGNKPKAEQLNLAEDPNYAAKRKEMEALLLHEMKRLHDPYRLWDQPKR